jgi:putative component of membrane protein insertase Oxa1/YidC/SpoIIIJ protein YidD
LKLPLQLALVLAAAWAVALPAAAEDLPLRLDDAAGAVTYLLDMPVAKREGQPKLGLAEASAGDEWDGSLIGGIGRSLFWGYRFLLSSQDSAACGFEPSCSRFSQLVIEEHGFFEGVLATFDRLSRDTPLGFPFYPLDTETGLLRDPPEQYCLGCKR